MRRQQRHLPGQLRYRLKVEGAVRCRCSRQGHQRCSAKRKQPLLLLPMLMPLPMLMLMLLPMLMLMLPMLMLMLPPLMLLLLLLLRRLRRRLERRRRGLVLPIPASSGPWIVPPLVLFLPPLTLPGARFVNIHGTKRVQAPTLASWAQAIQRLVCHRSERAVNGN